MIPVIPVNGCGRCLRLHCWRYELTTAGPGPFGALYAQRPDAERECAAHRRAWLADVGDEEELRKVNPYLTDRGFAELVAEWIEARSDAGKVTP